MSLEVEHRDLFSDIVNQIYDGKITQATVGQVNYALENIASSKPGLKLTPSYEKLNHLLLRVAGGATLKRPTQN